MFSTAVVRYESPSLLRILMYTKSFMIFQTFIKFRLFLLNTMWKYFWLLLENNLERFGFSCSFQSVWTVTIFFEDYYLILFLV